MPQATYQEFPPNTRKSRYAISYLSNIAAQAGVGFKENNPDEDHHAVDCALNYGGSTIHVQVKCLGSQDFSSSRNIRVPITEAWLAKWNACIEPVYLIAILLESDDHHSWIEHEAQATSHQSMGFWYPLNDHTNVSSVSIPRSNRLSVDSIKMFHQEYLRRYGERSSP